MIFYFSGTGNSYQAALAMSRRDGELRDISKCVLEGKTFFELEDGERLGFALPVYYGGLPSVAVEFLKTLSLSRIPDYCFAVFTCGSRSYGAPDMLARALRERGIGLHAAFTVKMPDNYVLMLRIPPDKKRERMLTEAEHALEDIRAAVDRAERTPAMCTAADRLMTRVMYPIYANGRKTAKFYSDDQCIGCGVCVKRCPARAMTMENGRPKWIKDRCIHCMACIRCGAVQYGRSTRGKKRYTNPILKSCH